MGRYGAGSDLILKEGVTTSNGNAGGTTIIDGSLIGKQDYLSGLQVRILSGTYQLITRTIESFNSVTGTITIPGSNPFPGQIVKGTGYVIMGVTASSAESLNLMADVGDASASTLGSLYTILGNPAQSFDTNLNISAAERLKNFIAKTGGTEVPAGSSLYGALGGTGFVTATDSLKVIAADVASILDMTRSEALVAVTAAETNLFIDDAPTIIVNGLSVKIDLTNMAAGDTYVLREYYRITNGGAYFRVSDDAANALVGAQSPVLKVVHLETYRYGCKVTAQKTAGTDRSFQTETIVEA